MGEHEGSRLPLAGEAAARWPGGSGPVGARPLLLHTLPLWRSPQRAPTVLTLTYVLIIIILEGVWPAYRAAAQRGPTEPLFFPLRAHLQVLAKVTSEESFTKNKSVNR